MIMLYGSVGRDGWFWRRKATNVLGTNCPSGWVKTAFTWPKGLGVVSGASAGLIRIPVGIELDGIAMWAPGISYSKSIRSTTNAWPSRLFSNSMKALQPKTLKELGKPSSTWGIFKFI